jgi:hypothetical protein
MDNSWPTLASRSFNVLSCCGIRVSSLQSSYGEPFLSTSPLVPTASINSLLKCLFPLLPRTTSQTLRVFLRKTILSVIRSANTSSKNHKLNRAVQAMLFGMVEQGLEGEVIGNKGKAQVSASNNAEHRDGEDAMWAVIMTKELWKEQIW